jgi:ribosomal protein L37AE/L43A
MTGEPTHYSGHAAAFCTCARNKGQCPHCFEEDFANYATWAWHIDKCHSLALANGWKPGQQFTTPLTKSIPSNASQQPPRSVL